MVAMPVLTDAQPIIGVDIHTSIPPVPAAPLPHIVVWNTGWSLRRGAPMATAASKAVRREHPAYGHHPVAVGSGYACGRGHDAGPWLPHIQGNTLFPLIMAGAASKAEFGSGTVRLHDQMNMAVHPFFVLTPLLHCNDPIPLPSGLTIPMASNGVYAEFTVADYLNGVMHTLSDIVIATALDFVMGAGMRVAGDVLRGKVRGMSSTIKSAVKDTAKDFTGSIKSTLKPGAVDWSRLTYDGLKDQVKTALRYHIKNIDNYNTKIAPKEALNKAKQLGPALLFGGPTGGAVSDSSPGAEIGATADDWIDDLFY